VVINRIHEPDICILNEGDNLPKNLPDLFHDVPQNPKAS
jgi:hypothetical protein